MSLASKRYVDRRIEESRGPQHGRRLEAVSAVRFPWEIFPFGYKVNPDGDNVLKIRIYAGEVDRIAVSQTDVVSSGGIDYVYIMRELPSNAMSIQLSVNFPSNSTTRSYYGLYLITCVNSLINTITPLRFLNIEGVVGFTGVVTTIGDLQYSGGSIQYKIKTSTYSNGLLTVEPTLGNWLTLYTP